MVFLFLNFNFGALEAEISLDQNCYQNLVQKHQGHVIPLIFGFRGIVPGTKSSGAHWILALPQNLDNDLETQDIGCLVPKTLFVHLCTRPPTQQLVW